MQRSKSIASNDATIDFGYRKRALVQIVPKQPKKNQLNSVFSWFSSFCNIVFMWALTPILTPTDIHFKSGIVPINGLSIS